MFKTILLGLLTATSAFAFEHPTYNCVLSNDMKGLAKGDFVSNQTLILNGDGVKFQISELGAQDGGPEQASSYQLELQDGDISAVTSVGAAEPHPYLQLTRNGKEITANCWQKR